VFLFKVWQENMGKYSIKELEQLSGIKAHTIRIWEKRHPPTSAPTQMMTLRKLST
jgi:hypothetical protein